MLGLGAEMCRHFLAKPDLAGPSSECRLFGRDNAAAADKEALMEFGLAAMEAARLSKRAPGPLIAADSGEVDGGGAPLPPVIPSPTFGAEVEAAIKPNTWPFLTLKLGLHS